MSERVDLLVSGGGLAGCAVALLAASRGARVLVVERRAFPCHKVCGEFVSALGCRVLERLGVLDEVLARGAVPVRGFRVTDAAGRCLDGGLPEAGANVGGGLGISRAVLDAVLADRARRAGATVLERHEALEPLFDGRRVAGLCIAPRGRPADGRAIRAPLVVAADGRRSLLARRLHPELCDPSRSLPRSWFGLATHFAADPRALDGRVELHLFDGGYAGLAGVEGGRVNLCVLLRVRALRACGGRPERLLRERILANPAARERIGDARPAPWVSVGPLRWGRRRPAAAGALFLGDAAGTIDPFSGDGMSHALRSAEIASPIVAAALERGALDDELARAYAAAWSGSFDGVTRRVRRLGRLFERPRLARATMALLRGPAAAWLPRLAASTREPGA